MRDEKIDYERAHEICSRMEFDLRKAATRNSFPGLSRRKLAKADLPKLTRPEFFEYVRRHYARNFAGRAAAAISDWASQLVP